ncbi:hypothetical protein [Paenibacillus sp. GYB003]|uniref:hypothetical protein n=1 Tax=Paenibacillus sp. GYB003 TaxID=2994392 RepID=UPI002F96AF0A
MWTIAGIVAAAALAAAFELPGMLRNRMTKDGIVFVALLVAGTAISIAYTLRVRIPNPVDFIVYLFAPASKWLDQMLS